MQVILTNYCLHILPYGSIFVPINNNEGTKYEKVMETLLKSQPTVKSLVSYLENAVVEDFATNVYSVFDYSDADNFIYVGYDPVHDDWTIESSSFRMTEADMSKVFDKVWEFYRENHLPKPIPSDNETPYYPNYNQV